MKKIKKAGALIIRDKKLLIVKPRNSMFYINPGGKYEGRESPEQCLQRELTEELKLEMISFSYYKTYNFSTSANTSLPLILELYFVNTGGTPDPSNEIETYSWLGKNDFIKNNYNLAPSFSVYFPDLVKDKYI